MADRVEADQVVAVRGQDLGGPGQLCAGPPSTVTATAASRGHGARHRGLVRTIMVALLERGASAAPPKRDYRPSGTTQVLGHNAPGLALYGSMGFGTHHAYAA